MFHTTCRETEIRRFFEVPNMTELVKDPEYVDRGSMMKSMVG